MAAGAVKLERVAQDGMRVRASAGASSFRRKKGLESCLKAARAQVKRLAQEREHPDPGVTRRQQTAREVMLWLTPRLGEVYQCQAVHSTAKQSASLTSGCFCLMPQPSVILPHSQALRPSYR